MPSAPIARSPQASGAGRCTASGPKDYRHRGIRTTCHSRLLLENVPAKDAHVAALLHQAGGVLMGKMATHEPTGGPASTALRRRVILDRACFTGGSFERLGCRRGLRYAPLLGTDTGG